MIYKQNYVLLMLLKTYMPKYLISCQELMKQYIKNGMKLVNKCKCR